MDWVGDALRNLGFVGIGSGLGLMGGGIGSRLDFMDMGIGSGLVFVGIKSKFWTWLLNLGLQTLALAS